MNLNELNEGLQAEASKIETETETKTDEAEPVKETNGVTVENLLLNDMTIIKNKLDTLNAQVEHQSSVISANKKFNIFILVIGILILLMCIYNALMNMDILKVVNIPQQNCSELEDPFYQNIYDVAKKPVIYLYPKEKSNIDVYLTNENMIAMWPKADTVDENEYHWNVTADPDGTLHQDNYEYSYLFWEGQSDIDTSFERGFCVSGEETGEFLRTALNEIGLTPEEYNEFIVYWLPKMENNKYNLITFMGIDPTDEYNKTYPLHIVDEDGNTPDSMLRINMVWKAVDEPVTIEPQTFTTFNRNGFTVVEWGGLECK